MQSHQEQTRQTHNNSLWKVPLEDLQFYRHVNVLYNII